MIQLIIELPECGSLKDKRRVVRSLRDKLRIKFRMSVAEIDLQDSLAFAQIGGAYVSDSREFGESVMNKVLAFVEDKAPVRIHDVQIHSEFF